MTSIAAPALIAAIAAGSAPAQAAPDMHRHYAGEASVHYAGFGDAANLRRDIARLDHRIDRARDSRRISGREAVALRRDVNRIERLFAQYQRGGLTRWEARTLEARVAEIDRALRFEGHDRNRWRG